MFVKQPKPKCFDCCNAPHLDVFGNDEKVTLKNSFKNLKDSFQTLIGKIEQPKLDCCGAPNPCKSQFVPGYGMSFPMDLDVNAKAMILGACFLVDYMMGADKQDK